MVSRYERFTASISGICRSIQKIETDEMKSFGLKGSHAQYLAAMDQHPEGLTASQLCTICEKDKAAVSRAVAELEEKGMIHKENGVYYRARLTLTPKGREISRQVCKKAETAVRLAETNISKEESHALFAMLDTIAEELRKVCKEGLPEE
ncbi:MAG: MarR family transcriptional regulator [Clostridia bacterium]|nr:MarR family transcriptional regulator [Clostridia bacterium]